MNSITLAGNLGQDAESRYLPDGTMVTNFSVATDGWEAGAKSTVWFRCALFGKRAEGLAPYLTKGTKVVVIAHFNKPISIFTRQDGTPGANYEVTVDTIKLMGGGQEASDEAPAEDDDLPF